MGKRHAPATVRNRDPILDVLKGILPATGTVLEVASGSGEHIAYFAPRFPSLVWQPSEAEPAFFPSIAAWCNDEELLGRNTNVRPPVRLDASEETWPVDQADAVLAINMLHISPWESCKGLLTGAGRILSRDGLLYLYGPFRQRNTPAAASNESFDQMLRQQNSRWGLRYLDDVTTLAAENGLTPVQVISMPANNLSVIFRKSDGRQSG